MATIDPPYLRWSEEGFFRGETVRIAFQLAGVAPESVLDLVFAIELETTSGASAVRATASLVSSVTLGQNGVQLIADPTALVPPLPAGAVTYEAVIESATLPSGWYRCQGVLSWIFGTRTVTAGRLHLREPAVS